MRALVIDDEKLARERLIRMIQKNSKIKIVGEAATGVEALELIEIKKPDVLFLDIEMPEMDGFAVARSLLNASEEVASIVFVTAFSDFALRAFEVNAIDYLLKPVNEDRLITTLAKLQKFRKSSGKLGTFLTKMSAENIDEKFAIKVGAKYIICDPEKISAILAKDHYSAILTEGKEWLSEEALENLLAKLDQAKFMRIHRSAIINTNFLKELIREGDRKYRAQLSDIQKTEVPVSRDKLEELKSKFLRRS